MELVIPHEIWEQIMGYAQMCAPDEVTGIGLIQLMPQQKDKFIVVKIFLPDQTVNPVYSQFDDGALNDIITDVITGNPEDATKLRFRWHSHAYGEVFFSPTDEKDIQQWESDWVINLVVNVRSEYLARFDQFNPIPVNNYPVNLRVSYVTEKSVRRLSPVISQRVKSVPLALARQEGGDSDGTKNLFGPNETV